MFSCHSFLAIMDKWSHTEEAGSGCQLNTISVFMQKGASDFPLLYLLGSEQEKFPFLVLLHVIEELWTHTCCSTRGASTLGAGSAVPCNDCWPGWVSLLLRWWFMVLIN